MGAKSTLWTRASWLEHHCQKKLKSFPSICSTTSTPLGAPTVGRTMFKINGFPAQESSGFDLFSILYQRSGLPPPCITLVAWLVGSVLSKAGERRCFLAKTNPCSKTSCSWWPGCWTLERTRQGMSPLGQHHVWWSLIDISSDYHAGFRFWTHHANCVLGPCLYHPKISIFCKIFPTFDPQTYQWSLGHSVPYYPAV